MTREGIIRQYQDSRCAQCGRLIHSTLYTCDRCYSLTNGTECAILIAELKELRHQIALRAVHMWSVVTYENGEAYRL